MSTQATQLGTCRRRLKGEREDPVIEEQIVRRIRVPRLAEGQVASARSRKTDSD
ncbi:MAG TPA: hypothetical protein VF386_13460 [Usitatibacter sp.]